LVATLLLGNQNWREKSLIRSSWSHIGIVLSRIKPSLRGVGDSPSLLSLGVNLLPLVATCDDHWWISLSLLESLLSVLKWLLFKYIPLDRDDVLLRGDPVHS
jgi:hypothetical protein